MNNSLFGMSKRLLLITGLISFLVLALLVLAVVILKWKINQVEALHQDLHLTINQKDDLLLMMASGQVAANAEARLASAFVPAAELASLLERFESTGRSAKIEFEVTNAVASLEAAGGFKLNFRLKGSFAGVYHFLRLLEALPYALRFDDLALAASGSDWSGNLALTLLSFLPQHAAN